ncbi:MAG: Unknown protein, partial [uncultured Aureispira sp.]
FMFFIKKLKPRRSSEANISVALMNRTKRANKRSELIPRSTVKPNSKEYFIYAQGKYKAQKSILGST